MPHQIQRAAALAVLALALVPATAAAKPTVTLAFAPQGADAGRPVAYGFTAASVPSKAKVVIQRQMGTAKKYKTTANLAHAPSGTGTLPALALGRYKLRIAVLKGKRVLAAKSAPLFVYGAVDFSRLFDSSEQSVTYSGHTFAFTTVNEMYPTQVTTLYSVQPKANVCRSVHVDWVPIDNKTGPPKSGVGSLSVVQESADAATDSSSDQQVGAFDAVLAPRESWSLTATSQTGGYEPSVYVNGTASCYSTSLVG